VGLQVSLPLHTVRDAIWRLEEQLRALLRLHSQGQTSFARRAAAASTPQSEKTAGFGQ
jgi:hypothetical protein